MLLPLRLRLRITMELDVNRIRQLTRRDVTRRTEKDGRENTGMDDTHTHHLLRQEVPDIQEEEEEAAISRIHRLRLRRTDMTIAVEKQ